jgi:hypothetical protein
MALTGFALVVVVAVGAVAAIADGSTNRAAASAAGKTSFILFFILGFDWFGCDSVQ